MATSATRHVSLMALMLSTSALVPLGCTGDSGPPTESESDGNRTPLPEERTAESAAALDTCSWGSSSYTMVGNFTGDPNPKKMSVASPDGGHVFIYDYSDKFFNYDDWPVTSSWGSATYTWPGDFNGDGKTDIASVSNGNVYMKLSTGSGFNSAIWTVTDAWGAADYHRTGDFNGDGKTDIVSVTGSSAYLKLSTGSGFNSVVWPVANAWGAAGYTWAADFNGDGKTDIASASGGNVYMSLSTGTKFTSAVWPVTSSWGSSAYTWVADFNGDGKMDIASANGGNVYMKLSTGSGFTSAIWPVTGSWGSSAYTWAADFNGDGRADLASAVGGKVYMSLSTGTKFNNAVWTVPNAWGSAGNTYAADFDGDGKADIVSFNGCTDYRHLSTGTGFTTPVATDAELASRFAPQLRFDGSAHGYPMSAQSFYDQAVAVPQPSIPIGPGLSVPVPIENTSVGTLTSGDIPTYYQIKRCGEQVRIMYWFFYGYQSTCDEFGNGSHNGDWEKIMVTLSESEGTAAAVTFWMHGKRYTRLGKRSGFSKVYGTHPVVYVGKNTHASFFNQGGSGVADNCIPWEEYRNNTTGARLDTWSKLVDLDGDAEPWISADRIGGFEWGTGGIKTHPTQDGPSCYMNACDWSDDVNTRLHTQCKVGDDDTGSECLKQCRSGYTNMGLTCTNWDIDSLDTYSRRYRYDYEIPRSDEGLMVNDD